MALARGAAVRLKHDQIGTEHLLLGLLEERSGGAAAVLEDLGVGLQQVRTEVEKTVTPGTADVTGRLPFSPLAKKALEHAVEEARALEHTYVGTEHLLLGLLREENGLVVRIFREQNLDLATIRGKVVASLKTVDRASSKDPRGRTALLINGLGFLAFVAAMHAPRLFSPGEEEPQMVVRTLGYVSFVVLCGWSWLIVRNASPGDRWARMVNALLVVEAIAAVSRASYILALQ
jgi:ATP-dependent Clp protease ATP-binding subunit ClpA